MSFVEVHRGEAPLIVSFPHTGTDIPPDVEARLISPWLGRKDADWHLHELYAFAKDLGATMIRTTISRTVVDCNRDPSGASLYPGQATTGLCPIETFDGELLYREGGVPSEREIAKRHDFWFRPYHMAIVREIGRLRLRHEHVVLYDAHSIRSSIPRLFDGELPQFNIGTHDGAACALELTQAVERACRRSGRSQVTNGRFKGGWTTRHYGRPGMGVHALQMELACRGYMDEPISPTSETWPSPFEPARAAALQVTLAEVLQACLTIANEKNR